jgi:glycosyltransferase involved in cell wall biosynthesis
MASGLYPVVSAIRGNREWIDHGRNGHLHEVANPESLAECIQSLIGGLAKIPSALVLNRAAVVEKGDRTANMLRLEKLYFKLNPTAAPAKPLACSDDSSSKAEVSAPLK